MKVSFKLNGKPVTVDVEPNEILLDTLRLKLGIKSVKRGCERAECGACTVLLNGDPVYSCTILTVQVDGMEVATLEGIEDTPEVKTLVSKFIEAGAVQCGFCTPGIIITAYAMIKKGIEPTPENIKKALEGNICRCTGYKKIIEAISSAAASIK
ncbi:MAG: (2Fe-2S)-binding protein [Desulfurococcales archaeon]|nr:(2Fe-2S)-binding protein [Desulfurococcales archaeon]